jgi:antitoxin (DNA-binding transcriptional repressor) of toxin-antitoxin stability system
MERTVGADEMRDSLGRILRDVAGQGDCVVVERQGEAVAAVVPMDVYNQWKRSRASFFERMERAAQQANLAPDEADQLAAEAVAAVRKTSSTA